jgi:hypothetical protein
MPAEGLGEQSITPSTIPFSTSIASYASSTITNKDLYSLLTEQRDRIKEEQVQAQSERDSQGSSFLASRGISIENTVRLRDGPPRKAFNYRPPGENPTEQDYAIARIGSQRGYITQLTEDLHLQRDTDNLEPMWTLMREGAAIFQSIFRCNIIMDAFGSRKVADRGVAEWSRQVRDMLQGMYNFPGKDKNGKRVKFLEGLERLKENMVWYAEFMKRHFDGNEVSPVQDVHLERLDKIGEDVAAFIAELQRLQDKQKKLEKESHESETVV